MGLKQPRGDPNQSGQYVVSDKPIKEQSTAPNKPVPPKK
jgi:hypothetical protein